jgi:hypothetical protein
VNAQHGHDDAGDFSGREIWGTALMVKENSGAGMLFYKRLVLAFCFPDGAEHTGQTGQIEHIWQTGLLRGEPEAKANQRCRDQIGDRGTAGARDWFLPTGSVLSR